MQERSSRRGNYSMFMGVLATGVIGFGALGVDLSYIAMSNSQAQAVADAASHAALVAYRTSEASSPATRAAQGRTAANYFVANNTVGLGETGDLDSLTFGIFNPSNGQFSPGAEPFNAARAVVTRTGGNSLELFLAPLLGQDTAQVRQEGVTAANPREVMVVVDRSCSMAWPWSNPGYRGVRDSLAVFGDYMVNHQVPLDRLGITSFSSTGDTWDPLRYINGNEADIRSKWSSWGPCPSPYAPYYAYACKGGTAQSLGIYPAVDALRFSGNELAFKAIIVISDGNPSGSYWAQQFLQSTEVAWSNDIHVWTVGFGQNINDGLMESATKGVGTYYRLPSSDGLEDVMLDIAKSIPVTIAD